MGLRPKNEDIRSHLVGVRTRLMTMVDQLEAAEQAPLVIALTGWQGHRGTLEVGSARSYTRCKLDLGASHARRI